MNLASLFPLIAALEWLTGLPRALAARPYLVGMLLAGAGMYLMLPPGGNRRRGAGSVLAILSLGFFCAKLGAGRLDVVAVFWILASITLISAAATVTSRNPVYCALWFGMTLLGTAGLFLFNGAQFLAVATMVVYAGAILVTFLFVLMLATPTGASVPDRISWEPLLSAATGAVLVGVLTMTLGGLALTTPATHQAREHVILADAHMAQLGGQLFGRHLVSVEIGGTLLMVALVGATAIVAHSKEPTPTK
jgi:NADH-quinone oxidoreductase subunit J